MNTEICSECNGTGWITKSNETTRCECVRRQLVDRRYRAAGVPRHYDDATLSRYEPTSPSSGDARIACANYVANWPCDRGLLLLGNVGVGKTHLAIAVLRELIAKGASGKFVGIYSLFSDLQKTYNENSGEWRVMQPLMEADVVVIDDLGARRHTDWAHDVVTELVTERYNQQRATILTTNYRGDELAVRLGVRLVSRLAESCERIAIDANDYRLRGKR